MIIYLAVQVQAVQVQAVQVPALAVQAVQVLELLLASSLQPSYSQ
jgi:hypothetical protein